MSTSTSSTTSVSTSSPRSSASHGSTDPTIHFRPPSLEYLPYDLILVISSYLSLGDIHALHSTCRTLYALTTTRSIYRLFASYLLDRCRPLPLKGFTPISDLTLSQLRKSVNQASKWEKAWTTRAPRPIPRSSFLPTITQDQKDTPKRIEYDNEYSNYMDNFIPQYDGQSTWYRVIDSPVGEEIDWLSPITSSYLLSSTKSGKVILSSFINNDPQAKPLATFAPKGSKWELWKCRVEFEERSVYFCMAKEDKFGQQLHQQQQSLSSASSDGNRIMDFILVKLSFRHEPRTSSSSEDDNLREAPPSPTTSPITAISPPEAPIAEFQQLASFKTFGVVMNVFLLDPLKRLLSAFVWCSSSNTIALYVLMDWDKDEYVFVDTEILCRGSSNWSCILAEWPGPEPYHAPSPGTGTTRTPFLPPSSSVYDPEPCIVLHSEEGDKAFQHFYPLSLLTQHVQETTISTASSAAASSRKRTTAGGPAHDREGRARGFFPGRRDIGSGEGSTGGGSAGSSGTSTRGIPKLSGTLIAPKILERAFDFPAPHEGGAATEFAAGVEVGLTLFNGLDALGDTDEIDDGSVEIGNGFVAGASSSSNLSAPTIPGVIVDNLVGPFPLPDAISDPTTVGPHPGATNEDPFTLPIPQFSGSLNPLPVVPNVNPFPFPPWYPESAHFVRQWWPTLSSYHSSRRQTRGGKPPRISCMVLLMAMHNHTEHRTRYILSQHYFSVPIFDVRRVPAWCAVRGEGEGGTEGARHGTGGSVDGSGNVANGEDEGVGWADRQCMAPWYAPTPFEVVCSTELEEGEDDEEAEEVDEPIIEGGGDAQNEDDDEDFLPPSSPQPQQQQPQTGPDDDDLDDADSRPRPLIAVDFGHAVWIEYVENDDDNEEGLLERQKEKEKQRQAKGMPSGLMLEQRRKKYEWLFEPGEKDEERRRKENGAGAKLFEFYPMSVGDDGVTVESDHSDMLSRNDIEARLRAEAEEEAECDANLKWLRFVTFPPYDPDEVVIGGGGKRSRQSLGGKVQTLEIPEELDLDQVETINIDQSQGAVILSLRGTSSSRGKIFVLCYE